ncbi:DUF4384 domain-containing protein [candidate division KSB1 bacterium]|nr:DUF4384 domain-containing protein [candidate division KSB1 bacterium]
MRNIITAVAFVAAACWQPVRAQPSNAVRVEIWPTQKLEQPFADDAAIDMSVRVSSRGYVTLYQINPRGGVEILYPKSHHCWRVLEPNRAYRLTELAEDIRLDYRGAEGSAYVGGVLTEHAMHIAPWLQQSFAAHGLPSGRNVSGSDALDIPGIITEVEKDIQFRLGANARPAFAVAPLHIQSQHALAREQRRDSPGLAPVSPKDSLIPSSSAPSTLSLQRNPSAAANAFSKQGKPESRGRDKDRDSLTTPFKGLRKPPAHAPENPKFTPRKKPSSEKQSPKKTRERN